jgi:hypothetical protein
MAPEASKNGEANFLTKAITLRTGLDEAQSVKALAREIAHCLLHSKMTPRDVAELEAESVAYSGLRRAGTRFQRGGRGGDLASRRV